MRETGSVVSEAGQLLGDVGQAGNDAAKSAHETNKSQRSRATVLSVGSQVFGSTKGVFWSAKMLIDFTTLDDKVLLRSFYTKNFDTGFGFRELVK